jgi:hypothetical protein
VAILHWKMDVEKFILLVTDHQAIYDACHSEHRNRLHCQRLGKNCTGDGRGLSGTLLLLLVPLCYYYYYYYYALC